MGQSNLSDAFPNYLAPLFNLHLSLPVIIGLLITIGVSSIVIWLYIKYLSIQKSLHVKYSFLEVKPTDRTLKTPLSTNQLFTVLHSLAKEESSGLFINTKRSISFEIVSTKEQGIRFILRVPTSDVFTIKKNLLAYLPGIEITEIEDYVALQLNEVKYSQNFRTQEIKLKNSYLLPLQDQEILSQHDPIAYITAHMTKLLDHELVAAQFICIPVHESTHSQVTKLVRETQERLENGLDISDLVRITKSSAIVGLLGNAFTFVINLMVFGVLSIATVPTAILSSDPKVKMFPEGIFNNSKKKRIAELGMSKQQQYQKVSGKIGQPLFETIIRFIVYTPFKEGVSDRLRGMFTSYETLKSSDQALKVKQPFLSFLQSEFINNIRFELLKNRFSVSGSNPVLSVSELSSMYHLPYTSTTKTEDLLQVKSPHLASPLALKQADTKLDITFAKNKYGDTETLIGQTLEERRRHTYIIGATGQGKSTLLTHMIYQDMLNGNGIAVLDPHGELVEKLLGLIPKERKQDVVYFNPHDIEHPLGINLLKLPQGLSKVELDREKSLIVSSLITIFHKLYGERYSGPRMEHILRNTVLTALSTPRPTLSTIYKLLVDSKFRKPIVDALKEQHLKDFWKKEFGKLGSYMKADQIMPITNKLGTFLTTAITNTILDSFENTLDMDEVMNNKKILLCNLSKGKIGADNSYFLGSLLIAEIQKTALRRIHIKEHDRKDFFLYIDEFQNFATQSFADILSEARKYRLAAILAHQNTVQIESDLLDTIVGNSGTTISFRTNSPLDEDKLLPLFSPRVEKGQMQNLPSFNFYIKISALSPQDAFTGEVEKFPIEPDEKIANDVIELSQKKYARKIDNETQTEQEKEEKPVEKPSANQFKRDKK